MKTSLSGALIALSIYAVVALPVVPPHPAVAAVRHEEEQLPLHLRSPAIFNPHLHQILSVTSLLHHGENLVFDREADKVSRHEIYKILTHAGLLSRRKNSHTTQHYPMHEYAPDFASHLLHNPELLQYL